MNSQSAFSRKWKYNEISTLCTIDIHGQWVVVILRRRHSVTFLGMECGERVYPTVFIVFCVDQNGETESFSMESSLSPSDRMRYRQCSYRRRFFLSFFLRMLVTTGWSVICKLCLNKNVLLKDQSVFSLFVRRLGRSECSMISLSL